MIFIICMEKIMRCFFIQIGIQNNRLVVKGAGAGAEVTASGVFADIIRAAG